MTYKNTTPKKEFLPLSLYELQEKTSEQKPYVPTGELSRGTLSSRTPDETWKLIWQGSFSSAANKSKQNRNGFFRNLLQAQVEHEAIQAGIRNLTSFQKFLTVLASRIGQEFPQCRCRRSRRCRSNRQTMAFSCGKRRSHLPATGYPGETLTNGRQASKTFFYQHRLCRLVVQNSVRRNSEQGLQQR